jgi:glycosyltransferase involved in cell wall biosynthesis
MRDGVVFSDLPGDLESEKDRAPEQTRVGGAALASADLIATLLRHGTSERYYVLIPGRQVEAKYRERLEAYPNGDRVVFVPFERLADLPRTGKIVLFSHLQRLFESAHIRSCVGSPHWIASSVTHALSYRLVLAYCFSMNLQHLYPHDSMICTSAAARPALLKLLAVTGEWLSQKSGRTVSTSLQLPIIPLGVDPERFQPRDRAKARKALGLPRDATIFLYLGRFSSAGKMDLYPMLLAFATAFAGGQEQAMLLVAGDDTEEKAAERLHRYAGELHVDANVKIWANPTSSEKMELYAAADVFTSLSDNLQETFGLTIIEAMACGLPVVASDWSGYRDLVVDGETGCLIPTYWADCTDEISQLAMLRGEAGTHWLLAQSVAVDLPATATAFRELACRPNQRREMGARGRARVLERFSWRAVVGQYEELWRESSILAEASPPPPAPSGIYGVDAYRHFDVFQHYPSHLLNGVTTLRISASGLRSAEGEPMPGPLERDRMGLRSELHSALLGRLADGALVRLEDFLTQAAADLAESRDVVSRHLLRLLKYGLVEVNEV